MFEFNKDHLNAFSLFCFCFTAYAFVPTHLGVNDGLWNLMRHNVRAHNHSISMSLLNIYYLNINYLKIRSYFLRKAACSIS